MVLWSGVWGAILAYLLPRHRRGARYWLTSLLLGAALPTLAIFGLVLATKGLTPAIWLDVIVGLIVNGAWGFGTALLLLVL